LKHFSEKEMILKDLDDDIFVKEELEKKKPKPISHAPPKNDDKRETGWVGNK